MVLGTGGTTGVVFHPPTWRQGSGGGVGNAVTKHAGRLDSLERETPG
jgi:hypothetical protein